MIISCASVLESPRRGASNTLPYDFIIELLVIKEKTHYHDLVFKAVVGGPAMTGPLFWPKMVFAGPLFRPIIYFFIFCRVIFWLIES